MRPSVDALRAVDFNWVRSLESVWIDDEVTIPGPNAAAVTEVAQRFFGETRAVEAHPNGIVLTGPSGIGKTHLVGNLRREVWQRCGWFVLLDVLGLTDFWRSAALSYITSLLQTMPDGRRQLEAVLGGVARRFNVEKQVDAAFDMPNIDVRKIV
jgi:DNA replication protein DnaC